MGCPTPEATRRWFETGECPGGCVALPRDDWIAMVGTDILVPEVEADVTHPDGRMRRLWITTALLYND